jgi:hypothetical protein
MADRMKPGDDPHEAHPGFMDGARDYDLAGN